VFDYAKLHWSAHVLSRIERSLSRAGAVKWNSRADGVWRFGGKCSIKANSARPSRRRSRRL